MLGKLLLEPTKLTFEAKGVLNPAAVKVGKDVHLFYRAIAADNRSSIGYCRLQNNEVVERWDKPVMIPEFEYEKMGVEDPRISLFEGTYYMLYTAYDGLNARVAYAVSTDLQQWQKKGLLSPSLSYDKAEDIYQLSGVLDVRYRFYERMYRGINGDEIVLWEKDAALFPRRINGMMVMLHRILPGIQICYFQDFSQLTDNYWRRYLKHLKDYVVLEPKYPFESAYLGAGCPPMETEAGWLLIHHSVQYDSQRGKIYRAGVALLDRDDPSKVLGRLKKPLFEPEERYELKGVVDNVVFPTGAVVEGDWLSIYYGCADKNIGVRQMKLSELIAQLS